MNTSVQSILLAGILLFPQARAANQDSAIEECPNQGPQLVGKTGAPLTLKAGSVSARAVSCVGPKLPALGRQVRLKGYVRLRILVDNIGTVTCVRLLNGHPLPVGSAIDARQGIS